MKFLVPILAAIIVIGGTTIGLGYAGVINIPGITPSKRTQVAVKPEEGKEAAKDTSGSAAGVQEPTQEGSAPESAPQEEPPPPSPPVEEPPPKDGTERLAKLWATMDAQKVAALVEKWKDGDVLLVLAKMDDEKLAEVLAALPPERALELSRGIKALEGGGR
jgi:hypothetical protein